MTPRGGLVSIRKLHPNLDTGKLGIVNNTVFCNLQEGLVTEERVIETIASNYDGLVFGAVYALKLGGKRGRTYAKVEADITSPYNVYIPIGHSVDVKFYMTPNLIDERKMLWYEPHFINGYHDVVFHAWGDERVLLKIVCDERLRRDAPGILKPIS